MGIPHRLQEGPAALQHIEQMKLSRTHRRLFLLIDGKRPAPDLAHLMGKAPEEVYRLLYDLERAGLIKHTEPKA
jgi:DNA-binding IclR family transcriptional regulator